MGRIVFLVNSLALGGAERVVATLLEEINEHLVVELICLEKREFLPVPPGVKITCLSDTTSNESGIKKLLMLPLLAWRLKKYCQHYQTVVVQSHMFRANYVNVMSVLLGAKHQTQVVTHGIVNQYKKKGLLGTLNLYLIKKLYPHADVIIANSKGVRDDLHNLFQLKKPINVIHNPFNVKLIEQKTLESFSKYEFQLSSKKSYIISIGRLVKLKRQADLIKAFNLLSKKHADCELLLLGEGEERENLVFLTRELNLSNKIHFLGNVSNPFKYLAHGIFSVLASESESFGNVIVESMICKCPVISTDCQYGPREILNAGYPPKNNLEKHEIEYVEYGILVGVGGVETLAKAMEEMLENEALRQKYIEKAYERSLDFDVEKVGAIYTKNLLNI